MSCLLLGTSNVVGTVVGTDVVDGEIRNRKFLNQCAVHIIDCHPQRVDSLYGIAGRTAVLQSRSETLEPDGDRDFAFTWGNEFFASEIIHARRRCEHCGQQEQYQIYLFCDFHFTNIKYQGFMPKSGSRSTSP